VMDYVNNVWLPYANRKISKIVAWLTEYQQNHQETAINLWYYLRKKDGNNNEH
jgi:hypothetical protein